MIKGDLDYQAKNLSLAHGSSAHPCSLCCTNKTAGDPLFWQEFRREHAEWMQALWSSEEWAIMHPHRHALFKIPGVGIENIYYDYMHCKHLGTDKVVYGSIMFLLCYDVMGGNPETNFAALWQRAAAGS